MTLRATDVSGPGVADDGPERYLKARLLVLFFGVDAEEVVDQ
jgi:hypothetical protein